MAYLDNDIINGLPNHLKQYIIDQNYEGYTPVDHAVWRYIMRKSHDFLKDHAHESYVEGFGQAGIRVDTLPSIEEMNSFLSRIGWAAVTVDGFIPPAAFMEFQAHRVLVIAADMRQINHIEYTPAPDIVHEAAGHAPIIANPDYAEYLRRFGVIGSQAMSSRKDYELYEAIRHLSILKETIDADPDEIKKAEDLVDYRQENLGTPSEMGLLSRLHWWTVEYGLVGTLENPALYGAGLLSSIGESVNCLKPEVKKLPYNLSTADYAFDITTQQPQLFVTPDFQHLIDVLERFADTMAFRVGGCEGLAKAIECGSVSTCTYSSGLQVSGLFESMLQNKNRELIFIKATGPCNLAFQNKELPGHDRKYHAEGFSSPVGKLKGQAKPLEKMTEQELAAAGISEASKCNLEFESGIKVSGVLESSVKKDGQTILLTFDDCTVTHGKTTLFDPSWGKYDMAVGQSIISVFCGAADKDAYDQVSLVPRERTVKSDYNQESLRLHQLYQAVRDCRENQIDYDTLPAIWTELKKNYASDWLLPLEILELLEKKNLHPELAAEIRALLERLSKKDESKKRLIEDGLALLN
ncbi:MAG: aromatic amino acid hydroxylase [bacterium]|nr:aromatic amino acid hydroxylase [bacterium]